MKLIDEVKGSSFLHQPRRKPGAGG